MTLKQIADAVKQLMAEAAGHDADSKTALPQLSKLTGCVDNAVTHLEAYKSDPGAAKLISDLSALHHALAKKHGTDADLATIDALIAKTQKDDEAELAALAKKIGKTGPGTEGSTQAARDKLEAQIVARRQEQQLRQEKLKAMQQKIQMKSSEEMGAKAAQDQLTRMGQESLYKDPIIWRRKLELTLLHACITAERKCSDNPGMASNCQQCFQDISSKMLNVNKVAVGRHKD